MAHYNHSLPTYLLVVLCTGGVVVCCVVVRTGGVLWGVLL